MNTVTYRRNNLGITDDPRTWGKFASKEEADAFATDYYNKVDRARMIVSIPMLIISMVALLIAL